VASQFTRYQVCNFYLWGNLKGKVYKNNPRSTEALQIKITRIICSITVDQLQKVYNFYTQKDTVPTARKLLPKLRETINFKGGSNSVDLSPLANYTDRVIAAGQ
jgi:hypothetical protein